MRYAHSKGHLITWQVFESAIKSGHLPLLDWIHKNRTWDRETINDHTITESLTEDVIDWLYANGYQCTPYIIGSLITADKSSTKLISLLAKFHQYIPDRSIVCCYYAIDVDNWQLLFWLKSQGYPWDQTLYDHAVTENNLPMLMKLREHGCPLSPNLCERASDVSLEILEWVHNQGIALMGPEYDHAIISSNINMIQYLHQNGCPWSPEYFCTALHTNIDILNYLYDHEFVWNKELLCISVNTTVMFDRYITDEIKIWLVQHGYLETSDITSFQN